MHASMWCWSNVMAASITDTSPSVLDKVRGEERNERASLPSCFARNSLRTVALAPRLPPSPRGDLKVHIKSEDRHPEHGWDPLHLILRRRQASHAFETGRLFVRVARCMLEIHRHPCRSQLEEGGMGTMYASRAMR